MSFALVGCNREPPDITKAEAKDIADKEQPKWCDSEGFHCVDFRVIGEKPPLEPGFEWNWQWGADLSPKPILMSVMVTKKGKPAVRIQAVAPGALPAFAGAALLAAAAKPAAPGAPGTAPATPVKTPTPTPTPGATLIAKAPVGAAPPIAKLDPNDPKPRTPPPLDPVPTTPPPLSPAASAVASVKSLEPTFDEVFRACETEIGILCMNSPSSVPQARNCLRPHRAALRAACGKTVGLKRSAFDEN